MKKTFFFPLVFALLMNACSPEAAASPSQEVTATIAATAAAIPSDTSIPTSVPTISTTPFMTGEWRITGLETPDLVRFDRTMQSFMQEHSVTAGALAVTYRGRLILAHGYTFDADQSYAVQPESLFRIASLSKPITAVTILKMVQDGQLSLETPVADILTFAPPRGKTVDPRLSEVTIADLLYHQGGWDIETLGYDPMFSDRRISQALGINLPITQADIITYMSGVSLSFDPGTKYAYSNFGYMLLGQVIESVSGHTYEDYVKENVLALMGATRTQLGNTLPENRLPGEVIYYSDFTGASVFDPSGKKVPWPDGGWNLENMAAHGGWVSTVVDMARLESSFDDSENNPVLSKDTIKLMFKAPPGTSGDRYYAMGWEIVRVGGGLMNTFHTGSLDGTLALMVRRHDGFGWVVIFNERDSGSDPTGDGYWEIDGMLHEAADQTGDIPDHDLFLVYP